MALSTGIFVSEDGKHKLTVTSVNIDNGTFEGSFTALDTPVGDITYDASVGFNGGWDYLQGQASLAVRVTCRHRPSNWGYVIFDSWVGCSSNNPSKILMSGARAYTNTAGVRQVFSFDNVTFTRQ